MGWAWRTNVSLRRRERLRIWKKVGDDWGWTGTSYFPSLSLPVLIVYSLCSCFSKNSSLGTTDQRICGEHLNTAHLSSLGKGNYCKTVYRVLNREDSMFRMLSTAHKSQVKWSSECWVLDPKQDIGTIHTTPWLGFPEELLTVRGCWGRVALASLVFHW